MAKASDFVEMSLLMDDDFGLLLAAEKLKCRSIRSSQVFSFNEYDVNRFRVDFRFHKPDVLRLKDAFSIPDWMGTRNGLRFEGVEGLCIVLRRLSYPNRLVDIQVIFGRTKEQLSEIFNHVLCFIYDGFHHLLEDMGQSWFTVDSLKHYVAAIKKKGSPLDGCFGFIDGTLHRTCRPTRNQEAVYSGHKRSHGLKYQSVVTPNGLIAKFYGPEPGRRHDSYVLNQSKLLSKLQDHIGADKLFLYGDSGYPLKKLLITPHLGANLPHEKLAFNEQMSKLRIAVEWEFGELNQQFAFISYKYNQKIFLQPVAKYVSEAVILKNCQTCLYGSQTATYFGMNPPTLEEYLLT